ncbi:uncharacterized protein [Amphiura filiformis]|uniref:uncharacterized protein n=1 Tax=Amphiura filiformis TaxID=82378 RepID=UPI003B2124D3
MLKYYDNFDIGEGDYESWSSTVFSISGEWAPNSVTVHSAAWIAFRAGRHDFQGAFQLDISWSDGFVPCESNEFSCSSGYGCLNQSLVCNSEHNCYHESDEKQCGCSDINILPNISKQFVLQTPLYPETYPGFLDCMWIVHHNQDNMFVNLRFQDFWLQYYGDWLDIGVGNTVNWDSEIFHFTGVDVTRGISLNASEVWIHFTSDRDNLTPYRGFWINITWFSELRKLFTD